MKIFLKNYFQNDLIKDRESEFLRVGKKFNSFFIEEYFSKSVYSFFKRSSTKNLCVFLDYRHHLTYLEAENFVEEEDWEEFEKYLQMSKGINYEY